MTDRLTTDLTIEQLQRIIANHESGVQLTGVAVYRQLLAAIQREAELTRDLKTALQGILNQIQWIEQMREALSAIDKQAMQVMQDDVPPYGSILRCGWVHEVCIKALRYEVRVLND